MEKTKITECAKCQEEKKCDLVHIGLYDVMYLCYACIEEVYIKPVGYFGGEVFSCRPPRRGEKKIDINNIAERLGGEIIGQIDEIEEGSWADWFRYGKMCGLIYPVSTGAKPVSSISIPKDKVDKFKDETCEYIDRMKELEDYRLCVVEEETDYGSEFYFYKYPHLKEVINYMIGKPHNEDVVREWLWGKMYGYSEEEIHKYIQKVLGDFFQPAALGEGKND